MGKEKLDFSHNTFKKGAHLLVAHEMKQFKAITFAVKLWNFSIVLRGCISIDSFIFSLASIPLWLTMNLL